MAIKIRKMMDNNDIVKFWDWFEKHIDQISNFSGEEHILEVIDEKVRSLGEFEWEIGPGIRDKYAFVISPGRDAGKFSLTRKVLAFAPKINNWELYPAKPPKKSKPVVKYPREGNSSRVFNGESWQYVLLQYPDNEFLVMIKVLEDEFSHPEVESAVELIIEGLIGEELFINSIAEIEVVEQFTAEYQGFKSNLSYLRAHLNELIS